MGKDPVLQKLGFDQDDAYTQIGKRMRKIYTSNRRYRLFDWRNKNGVVNKDSSIQCTYMNQEPEEAMH